MTSRAVVPVRASSGRMVLTAVMMALLGLAQGPARAQNGNAGASPPPMALTALDYFEIQQLIAKYARAIDTCSNNGYDYADLFVADGYFAPIVNGQSGAKFQGRDTLAEISGGGARGCKNVPWIEQGVVHIYTNHIITATADGATGTVDMLMIGLGGDPNKIEYDGYYQDVYVKTPQGWRFKSRTHHAVLVEGRRAVGER